MRKNVYKLSGMRSSSVFWALRGMCKYLTLKSTFTNKSCSLCMCQTPTEPCRVPHGYHTGTGSSSATLTEGLRCLQAVYLALHGTEPKLINCSWLHAELTRGSALWSCHHRSWSSPRRGCRQLHGEPGTGRAQGRDRALRVSTLTCLKAATQPTYHCTWFTLHHFRAHVQHFMACTIFHWSVIKRLQLGQ